MCKMENNFLQIGILSSILVIANALTTPCDLRATPDGGVCVCTTKYCDYLDDPTPLKENQFSYTLVSSSKGGLRFSTSHGLFNRFNKHFVLDHNQVLERGVDNASFARNHQAIRKVTLSIKREKQHRRIVGFGGGFTGAVSYLLEKLPQDLQDQLYRSYYARDGIGWTLLRMPIGGCDFDLAPWAYNELPENDTELSNFTQLDAKDLIKAKQIHRLKDIAQLRNLRIKGAAWSPPRWMKTNNRWTGFGQLKREYYQTWANYHLKWLQLMADNGLPVWAISTGNEPMNGIFFMYFVRFMSLGWLPFSQAVWLNDHLGPTIRNSSYKDLIIFGNDDQRYTIPTWFKLMKLTRSKSLDYIDALAVHWYWDDIFKPVFIDKTLAQMPNRMLLITESCIGDKPWQKSGPILGSWYRGEKYARGFLQNLQHGFNGWVDWNLILDENGGPNYVNNTVDAPIIVNATNPKEILKQPMFYTMGHFSKFLPEGSARIDAVRSNVNIDSVAYLRPDGSVAAVLFNSANTNIEVQIDDSKRGGVIFNLPPRSIHTILYN